MHLLAISVGNTRTRLGVFRGGDLDQAVALENTDPAAIAQAVGGVTLDRPDAPAVMASVNDPVADALERALESAFRGRWHRFGRDIAVPIRHALPDASSTGQDRLLNALAAYSRFEQACVVIDAGTAVTVDFVDGEGVFQGGAIGPGAGMMLRALHEGTAALPSVEFSRQPDPGCPFGRGTSEAMLLGVRSAVIGMARLLTERYAEAYGAYPSVIATGGDAHALFEGDPIVERIVPDLTLLGIHAACERLLSEGE
jgi:type III pantothenate kinase